MTQTRKPYATPKKKRYNYHHSRRRSKETHQENSAVVKPQADPVLNKVFSRIGNPDPAPFRPDPFQSDALSAIQKTDCLVTAPTGAGKTWIAERAIQSIYERGGRCWYASPLKALTNSKRAEFGEAFGDENVGILTGDTKENSDAPIIVGTTEILRNKLYEAMHSGEALDCDLVILDEAHFLGDKDRGVVWEEIMIYLPTRINMLMLSATIGNSGEIAGWLSSLRNKECVVISGDERPVPLYPLFLHPLGKITPLLNGRSLNDAAISWLEKNRNRRSFRGKLPPFDTIIEIMREFNLLPAIFFLKSRGDCDAAVNLCKLTSDRGNNGHFEKDLQEILEHHPYMKNHKQLHSLRYSRVGAHHGGQLPAWKSVVETMMKGEHLDAVFATSTVAAGVNFPARTVVLFNSDQFNGHEFMPLGATAFHQMTGRAGRRGQDKIGFMMAFPGKFMDLLHIQKVYFSKPEKITSRIRSDFSMAMNLLLSHNPEGIKNIFERSFADYQHKKNGGETILWEDFSRHLDFLKAEGFVDEGNSLTEDGVWTSQLRLDQPLLIAQCLRDDAFPYESEALLAAVIAPFAYDRSYNTTISRTSLPKRLRKAIDRTYKSAEPLSKRMTAAGFDTASLPLWTSAAIYSWASGTEWDRIVQRTKMAEGDLAMLISRTADSLHQIASLKDTHPRIASLAATARRAILREPVVFD
ncbi:MAG: DEAD/DEAH box helicase [Deltaproteobacteria bacterium]|nr:DEAD/DEAH box helicase [Deltaproteobacteria bacterium]